MSLNEILSQAVSQSEVDGHFLPQSDHFIPDCSTGMTGMTGMTEIPGKTGISVMNGMTRVTGMTGKTRVTGMTEMTRSLE